MRDKLNNGINKSNTLEILSRLEGKKIQTESIDLIENIDKAIKWSKENYGYKNIKIQTNYSITKVHILANELLLLTLFL